jgi:amino acid/amide ABC transporter substrate-binding protein, HAAT family (TC 3.A.1.4.-)
VPIIGGWPLSMSNFIDNAGPNGEGARMPQTFIQEADSPKRRAFIEAWQKLSRAERMPSPSAAAQGYDGMLLLAAAIRQAGTTHGSRVREALENLREKVEGVIMTYEHPFSRSDHEAIDGPAQVTMGEVRSGRVVRAYEDGRKKSAK